MRLWLGQLIEEQPELTVCGEADNVRDGLQRIAITKPDLVIVDISLPGASGMELIKTLKAEYPRVQTIVLSMHDEKLELSNATELLREALRWYELHPH